MSIYFVLSQLYFKIHRAEDKDTLKIKCFPTTTIEKLCKTILKLSNETRVGMGLVLSNCDGEQALANATVQV